VLLLPFVVALLATPSNAQTAPAGVGTSNGLGNVLSIDLGSLLKLSLVNELSNTTIDPASGSPLALSQLQLLNLQSATVPTLDGLTVPLVETRTSGAEDRKDTALLDLGSLGLPANLLTGAVNPATLSSVVGGTGALSSLTTSLDNIAVLGGLLKTDAAAALLGSSATPGASDATRGLSISQLSALDVGGLLQLLGIPLDQLPLTAVTGLVGQLGIPLDTINQATGLNLGSLTDLANLASVLSTPGQICDVANQLLLGLLGAVCTNNVVTNLGSTQTAIQGLLDLLAGTALLDVQGIEIGQKAVAADTLASSVASTTGSIGSIRVGGVDLGAVDLNTTLDQITGLANQITSTISGLLGSIDPGLANLVQVTLFDRLANVAQDGSYTTAQSGITALQLAINPPDVCAILGRLNVAGTVNGLLAGLGAGAVTVPTQVTDLLTGLTSQVPCGQAQTLTAAITQPLTVKALSVSGAANFMMPVAPIAPVVPQTPVLPRTGGESNMFLLLGASMVIIAIGARRLTRHQI
jgi:hypothetical protein